MKLIALVFLLAATTAAKISKNKKDDYLYITDQLLDCILSMSLENLSKNDYLFRSKDNQQIGVNVMYERFRKVLKKFRIIGGHTLYSWKHTGVVAAYNLGVDLKAIQLQCRHHSIEMTDNYLKSLGFGENAGFRKMNKFRF